VILSTIENRRSQELLATRAAGLPANRWTHLAMTYKDGVMRVFVGGRRISSRSVSLPLGTRGGELQIGIRFKGRIDDVRLWRRALSPAAVKAEIGADASRRAAAARNER